MNEVEESERHSPSEGQLKLSKFVNDIQKIDGTKDLVFSEIMEYIQNEYTRETAQNYLDALEKMITTIDM